MAMEWKENCEIENEVEEENVEPTHVAHVQPVQENVAHMEPVEEVDEDETKDVEGEVGVEEEEEEDGGAARAANLYTFTYDFIIIT